MQGCCVYSSYTCYRFAVTDHVGNHGDYGRRHFAEIKHRITQRRFERDGRFTNIDYAHTKHSLYSTTPSVQATCRICVGVTMLHYASNDAIRLLDTTDVCPLQFESGV